MLTANSHTGFGYSLEISFEDGSLPLTTERKCDKHDVSRRCQFHYRGCSWYWQTTPSGKKRDVVWCLANFTQTMTVWKEKNSIHALSKEDHILLEREKQHNFILFVCSNCICDGIWFKSCHISCSHVWTLTSNLVCNVMMWHIWI